MGFPDRFNPPRTWCSALPQLLPFLVYRRLSQFVPLCYRMKAAMLDILLFVFLIVYCSIIMLLYVCLYLACYVLFQSSFSRAGVPGAQKRLPLVMAGKTPAELGSISVSLIIKGLQITPHTYSLLNAELWMCCLYLGSRDLHLCPTGLPAAIK